MRAARRWLVALLGALAAGVAMSFGQTYAPEWLSSLFNSAAPVVALAAAVSLASRRLWGSVMLGALAGPLAMIGYYATSDLRGYGVDLRWVVFWSVAGLISGGAMGAATWALRSPVPALIKAVAAALWPGIALGEAAHGLVRVADTTSVAYWWAEAALGVAVLAWLSARRVPGRMARAAAVVSAAVIAVATFAVYGVA